MVPHITDAIQEWVENVAKVPVDGDEQMPDVCIVEVSIFLLSLQYDTSMFTVLRPPLRKKVLSGIAAG